jgi:hypothetical protein
MDSGAALQTPPRWLEEIELGLTIAPHFIVHGNIRDLHLLPGQGGTTTLRTTDALLQVLVQRGYGFALIYDRSAGFSVEPASALETARRTLGEVLPWARQLGQSSATQAPELFDPRSLSKVMEAFSHIRTSCALIVENASRLFGTFPEQSLELIELGAWRRLGQMAPAGVNERAPYNPTFWLCDALRDFPSWLIVGNDRMRTAQIGMPDFTTRSTYIESIIRLVKPDFDKSVGRDFAAVRDFVLRSEGLSLRAIESVVDIARERDISLERINDAIRCYKIGLPRDPWRESHLRQRLKEAEAKLGNAVIGQEIAVRSSLDILKRSVLGLSGAQSGSSPNRPRGVLFFAGPTGVGKTELAKSISEVLFGDKDSFVRFDMSEFSLDHAEARLVGAPPGYVGYDSGGELVNAIRERPFSVLLFDEIEKAHPRILDKFLQILEDGRLTDGRGDTVYFSDAVIIFTSNLGIMQFDSGQWKQAITPESDYEAVKKGVLEGVRRDFKERLQRPELLNRIGDNILVFDFIRDPHDERIMDKVLVSIADRLKSAQDLTLEIMPQVRARLLLLCRDNLANGGRGIANVLETCLVNPLARAVFDKDLRRGDTVTVTKLSEAGAGYSVEVA